MRTAESLFSRWLEAVNGAWSLARGERGNELRGRRVRRFDGKGLHPFSAVWGEQQALAAALELPVEWGWADTVAFKAAAYLEAEERFAGEVAEKGAAVFEEERRRARHA